jgi:hypothetical protein
MINLPIPGQSLTDTPKNALYERPPQVTDPDEAIRIHLNRLTNPEVMEDIIFFLQIGTDIVSLVEGITRSAVMQGIHTVDMSLIVAPVLHEYIKQTADILEIEYDEGFEDKKGKQRKRYARNAVLAKKKMKEMGALPKEVAEDVNLDAVEEQVQEEPMVEEQVQEEPKGLMARKV